MTHANRPDSSALSSPITPTSETFIFPASFSQQRLWFLEQVEGVGAAYNIQAARRLQGPLNLPALQQAVQTIGQRHESLRTTFDCIDDQIVQVIHASVPLSISILDFTHYPEVVGEADPWENRLNAVLQYAYQDSLRRFNLQNAPLWRVHLCQLAPDDQVLLLTIHHIIADGWSMGVLWQELSHLYQLNIGQALHPLPDLTIQYADYTLWQRERLQGDLVETQLNYWKQKLAGEILHLQLPTDRPRPREQTFAGGRYPMAIASPLTQTLKALSRQENSTLFMTLLAAFQVLLFRYSGQSDILVGSPIAGRNQAATEHLIGFLLNTLVLRSDLSGNPSFRSLLAQVRQTTLDAYDHQDLPFEKIIEELRPTRERSRSSLFQAMLILQNMPSVQLDLPGVTSTELDLTHSTSKFDITLSLWEKPEGLRGYIEYNTDLFEAATIERFSHHFQILLEGIVANPDQPIATLPLLTPAEQQHLLVDWNNTTTELSCPLNLPDRFAAQVDRTPDAIAVIDATQQLANPLTDASPNTLTYAELNQRVNQLAHYLTQYLQRLGTGTATRIGICMERSIDLIVSILAVLKIGAAYVPLDPNYPSERLAFMLADAQVSFLLTQQALQERLPTDTVPYCCIDTAWNAIAQAPMIESDLPPIDADQPAYVIYTSGSTGQPKGVVGLHRGVINRLDWMQQIYPFAAGEVGCQKTTLSFVDSVWEIFAPLLWGVPLVLIPDRIVKDPEQLLATLATHRVSRIVLVPSLLRLLLQTESELAARLPDLKYWISSGEVLEPELRDRFYQVLPDRILLNLYGSSEVAADATCHDTRQSPPCARSPIGRPIHNTQIYLLDRHLQPVPIGVPGEIHIGGAGLAQGYFDRPQLTAAKFIPNPFLEPTALPIFERFKYSTAGLTLAPRLYKTGDLGRYLPDGTLEYLGRLDDQVKIRGIRIELGEIATALQQHSNIATAIAILLQDEPDHPSLIAYIVFQSGMAATSADLHYFLRQILPDYMLPVAYVPLEALPLTPNGKINRQALPLPNASHFSRSATFVPPQTATEQQLAEIWRTVLKQIRIGIHDNFFAVGGHSLLATQVTARIRRHFQVELALQLFFATPTIQELAAKIDQLQTEQSLQQSPAIVAVSREAWRRSN